MSILTPPPPMIKKQRLNRKSNGVDFPSIYICHVRTKCICTSMAENYQKMLYTVSSPSSTSYIGIRARSRPAFPH